MRKNRILARLRAGEVSTGLWMNAGSPLLAELGAHAGFDWILLDRQHGHWDDAATISAMQVIGATDTVPIARVLRNDPARIGQLLDAGALGIVVPMVNTPQEAARAVAAMRYPPLGQRSMGGPRLRLYGEDYFAAANEEIMVAVMIETRQAAEHARDILSVPGVDLGFIGPVDLARSLGTWGQASEEHEAAIQGVLAAGKSCGTPVGIYAMSVEDAGRRAEEGFQFMPIANDIAILTGGMSDIVGQWRSHQA